MEGQGGGEAQGVADPPKKLLHYVCMLVGSWVVSLLWHNMPLQVGRELESCERRFFTLVNKKIVQY
jgi:hypothetical protein